MSSVDGFVELIEELKQYLIDRNEQSTDATEKDAIYTYIIMLSKVIVMLESVSTFQLVLRSFVNDNLFKM